MRESQTQTTGTLPVSALAIGAVLVGLLTLVGATQNIQASFLAVLTASSEGALAGLIVVAAGGYGYLILRRLAPADTPKALTVITAAALGLWLLSTAVLVVGSATHGLLRGWFAWPVVGGGTLLAAWLGRKGMESWSLPGRLDGRSLIWVLLAATIALWIAGATRPPAIWEVGFSDEYDVLEYHFQVPREFYDNQHIGDLPHNCYSHYPLGLEMLFLLGMCLRGGAYEGVFLAKFIHGAFAALSVAAVLGSFRRDEDLRGRFSAVLLATAPMVVYLSWLGLVELSEVCYLTLALLWLRQWMLKGGIRSAACVGLMLGGACAVKYLSVGFVAAPVLAAMLGVAWRRASLLGHVAAAGALTAVLFSPWLIRNAALTGNPVFPLATDTLGRGHWSAESQQRWMDGHAPDRRPPVPPPADWRMPQQPDRLVLFYRNFLMSQWFGPVLKLLAGLAICVLIAGGKDNPWDWALAAVFVIQLALWMSATQGMPPRFVMPALAPMSLLAGGLLARVSRIQTNPFNPSAPRPAHGPWGAAMAVAAFVAAAGINLLVGFGIYRTAAGSLPVQGIGAEQVAKLAWPWKYAYELSAKEGSRILAVGEAKAFYLPSGTLYAAAFDEHPLVEMARRKLSAGQTIAELRARGVTHLWVDWLEIVRLSQTYGYPAELSEGLAGRLSAGLPPRLGLLEALTREGMTVVDRLDLPAPTPDSSPATGTAPASGPATAPASAPAGVWPMITIYALPPVESASAPAGSEPS